MSWEQGILAVEAGVYSERTLQLTTFYLRSIGSGLGALREVLTSNPRIFDAACGKKRSIGGQGSPSQRAASIYSLVR